MNDYLRTQTSGTNDQHCQRIDKLLEQLEECDADGDEARAAKVLVELAVSYIRDTSPDLSGLRQSRKCLARAIPLMTITSDRAGLLEAADSLSEIGRLYFVNCEYEASTECFCAAAQIYARLRDLFREGVTLMWIGICAEHRSDYKRAIRYLEAALPIVRESGDEAAEARLIAHLGVSHENSGDGPRAIQCYAEALPLLEQSRDYPQLKAVLRQLSRVFAAQGDTELAEKFKNKMMEIRL